MSGREIFALCGWCAVCRGNGKDTRQGVVGGGRREGGVGVAMNWLAVEDSFTDKTTDYACDEGDCDSKREDHLPSFPLLANLLFTRVVVLYPDCGIRMFRSLLKGHVPLQTPPEDEPH